MPIAALTNGFHRQLLPATDSFQPEATRSCMRRDGHGSPYSVLLVWLPVVCFTSKRSGVDTAPGTTWQGSLFPVLSAQLTDSCGQTPKNHHVTTMCFEQTARPTLLQLLFRLSLPLVALCHQFVFLARRAASFWVKGAEQTKASLANVRLPLQLLLTAFFHDRISCSRIGSLPVSGSMALLYRWLVGRTSLPMDSQICIKVALQPSGPNWDASRTDTHRWGQRGATTTRGFRLCSHRPV